MKRSLISGMFDLFKGVADLISCTTQVLDNLVKATTDLTKLPIDEIGLLTDTLHDIGNEIDKKNDPTNTGTQASETGSSTASSTTSCTTSLTVIWESVFCTVKTTLNEESASPEETTVEINRRDEGCSTTAYSVVTDCTATASTATSTTTTTETPTGTPLTSCDMDTCGYGSDSCGLQERGLLNRRSTPRKSEPATCKWAEKSNYDNPADFMANEVKLAVDASNVLVTDKPFASKLISFQDQPISVALTGLYGCTSIIAVSRRGAWISYIFEDPVFRPKVMLVPIKDVQGNEIVDPATGRKKQRPVFRSMPDAQGRGVWQSSLQVDQQLDYFSRNCLTRIRESDGSEGMYGLSECRKATQAESGYWQGHVFDDDSDTKVFLVAPWERVSRINPNFGKETPTGLQLMWDSADTTENWGFVRAD
jgi:hypothetical protein